MIFSASIGVDVVVTGIGEDCVVFFRIGDGGDGKVLLSVNWAGGFET